MTHPGVELLKQLIEPGLLEGSILERRAAMVAGTLDSPAPEGVDVLDGILGGLSCEWLIPTGTGADVADDSAAILYLHGGGYCMGNMDSHRTFCGRLALAANIRVVMLDYRLAPESPYPRALDDAVAGYRALAKKVDPARIILGGDSAGGGLALATLAHLRDEGDTLPAAAVLLSPWADLTQSADCYDELDGRDPLLQRDGLQSMADAYLEDTDPQTPGASPIFGDLAGLPPTHISVGDQEILLDDSRTAAKMLSNAGVDNTLTIWPDLTHVFQIFPEDLIPESQTSIEEIAEFTKRHL